jgi:hypothetical protein
VPDRLQSLLESAGVLVSVGRRERRRALGETQVREAAAHFATWNYCRLYGLLHPAHLRALSRYYWELIAQGSWS